jgi:23S rRNA (adenine2503-C2)-methyltransferase
MDLKRLDARVAELGEPAYRARQVWEWTAGGADGYAAMTNVPLSLREVLAADVPFSTLTAEEEQQSRDGTVKTLFRTDDGHPVEAVLMRYRDGRRSVCVSSQSGCPLTCTFCATGQMAFGRNLTASEILDQVLHFVRHERTSRSRGVARGAGPEGTVLEHGPGRHGAASGARGGGAGLRPAGAAPAGGVTHLVFMGMGEPFMNVDAVLEAARRLPDLGVTHRRTTISTVGWIPGLRRFVDDVSEPIRLALSLHAADPALRSELMPVNDRYPLADVLALCRQHWERTKRRVFVEYVMLAGVNDSRAQARLLAETLGRDAYKVNLIPYNPTGNGYRGRPLLGSSRDAIAAFKSELDRAHVPATVRLTRGRDIAAACGQLATDPRPRVRA